MNAVPFQIDIRAIRVDGIVFHGPILKWATIGAYSFRPGWGLYFILQKKGRSVRGLQVDNTYAYAWVEANLDDPEIKGKSTDAIAETLWQRARYKEFGPKVSWRGKEFYQMRPLRKNERIGLVPCHAAIRTDKSVLIVPKLPRHREALRARIGEGCQVISWETAVSALDSKALHQMIHDRLDSYVETRIHGSVIGL